MGLTDIDDKIVRRAEERGVTPESLATQFESEFFQDMTSYISFCIHEARMLTS